jgi:Short C-terminal domain/Bacterial PH domain
MNELDRNLLSGESIVFETRKHWFAPIRASLIAGLLIVGFLVLRWLSPNGEGFFGTIGGLMDTIGVIVGIVGVLWIGLNVVEYLSAHFGVTNMRVLRYEGIVRRSSSETLLPMITDVMLEEPAVGRMLGYGNLRILTSSGAAGEDRFDIVKDAGRLRTAIQEQKASAMLGGGAGPVPTAPGPLAVPPPGVAAAAAVAPSPAPPAPSPADEAAAALARLADMHTQGLITDADYEAKKAEILGRI